MNHSILSFSILRPALEFVSAHIPLFSSAVPAGFPSPAEDYIEGHLSLDEHLIPHREATFFVRAKGNSMVEAGIFDGDILVVDKSLTPEPGDIVVAVVDGEFTVKYLARQCDVFILKPANSGYRTIEFREGQELQIWGVITSTIKKFR